MNTVDGIDGIKQCTVDFNKSREVTNTIRRSILEYVSTYAIHKVDIHTNTSTVFDCQLIQSLQMVPVICGDDTECQLLSASLTVCNTLPTGQFLEVTTDDFKINKDLFKFPFCMPLLLLNPGEEISLTITLARGNGLQHAKFSPVSTCYLTNEGLLTFETVGTMQPRTILEASIKALITKLRQTRQELEEEEKL